VANKIDYFDLKELILKKIKENDGWVNAHAHFDRAYTITPDLFKLVNKKRDQKWLLNGDIRKNSTVDQIYDRIAQALELLIAQGVTATCSFIDVNEEVKDRAIKAAQKAREAYGSQIEIKYINLNPYGIVSTDNRKWFEEGAQFADIVGSNVKTDHPNEDKHIEIVLETAKRLNKMAHLHVDELNDPEENETELLAKKTIEFGMEGKVVGIHGISIGAKPIAKREEIYRLLKKAEMILVANPITWIDGWRSETLSPIHNSITPADELTEFGIPVAIGIDNLYDIFKPMNDGNMWNDLRLLMEANRWFDVEEIVKVATVNGRKAMGIE
jgi:cytosine/creatinine deaminase